MAPSKEQTDALRRRIGELEQRTRDLEQRIAKAGEILGHEALTIAGKANAWLAAIVESSDDAIVSKDLNGVVTSWNPAAERMFGYTAAEMIGEPILRIIPEHLAAEERYILSCIKAGKRVDHFETVRQRKDGSLVNISVTVSPVRDAAGHVVGASKVARDVTAQRQADGVRGLLAAIVESSDDAIISKDLTGIVTSWNSAAQRLYGYTAEEMVGSPVLRIVPPELYGEEEHILAKIRAGERLEHYETVRMTKDGRRVEVSLTISPVRNSAGAIIGASKVAHDLTFAREADRNSAMLAAIVRSSDDAIISKTLDGTITSWNPGAERLYGFKAEEIVGQPIYRIVPPHLRGEEDTILAKLRNGERIDHFETVRVRRDGALVPVSLSISPVYDSAGRLIGCSKIARDITAQRDAERQKDQFLAVLAHELRNPLAPIRNAIALFGRDDVSPEVRDRVRGIAERQFEHMARLLDDLLDVSRIANGKVELQRERLELRPLVEQAMDATRALFDTKRHALRVDIVPEPLWLDADRVRIVQIVANLLTNAAKYTDPGGNVALEVKREGDEAVIAVSDDGIGFAPAMRERLFVLFSQEETALQRAAGGLGIGLALVREFVERHGGRVDAYSAGPGKGSRFTVCLPLAAAAA